MLEEQPTVLISRDELNGLLDATSDADKQRTTAEMPLPIIDEMPVIPEIVVRFRSPSATAKRRMLARWFAGVLVSSFVIAVTLALI